MLARMPTTRTRKPPATPAARGGRPSKIDAPFRTRDGRDITVSARIIELVEGGAFIERAARAAGIQKGTLYGWLEVAGQARQALGAGLAEKKITAHQRRCMEFSDAVELAEAEYECTGLVALEQIGLGLPRQVIIEKHVIDPTTGATRLVERTTRQERSAPSPGALIWKLTRRFPERYQVNYDPGAAAPAAEADLTPASLNGMLNDVDRFLSELEPGYQHPE